METPQSTENFIPKLPSKTDAPKKNEILCCGKPLEFILRKGSGSYVPQTADCPTCKAYFEQKPGNENAYKSVNDGASYSCTKCGTHIKGGRVAHPIWDGPSPMSGGGQCQYERVPYCPSCEKEPNFHGTPIEVK